MRSVVSSGSSFSRCDEAAGRGELLLGAAMEAAASARLVDGSSRPPSLLSEGGCDDDEGRFPRAATSVQRPDRGGGRTLAGGQKAPDRSIVCVKTSRRSSVRRRTGGSCDDRRRRRRRHHRRLGGRPRSIATDSAVHVVCRVCRVVFINQPSTSGRRLRVLPDRRGRRWGEKERAVSQSALESLKVCQP